LAAERSEADKPAKAHKTIFAPQRMFSVSFNIEYVLHKVELFTVFDFSIK
jgi:hypothetical protein